MWTKCSHGTKCHTVGLAKIVWKECSAVTFCPQKMFKTKCSGVDEQSVHLEIKCHSGRSEQLDIVLGGGCRNVSRTFQAWTFRQGTSTTQWRIHRLILRQKHPANYNNCIFRHIFKLILNAPPIVEKHVGSSCN
jgi:hypothetical protein